MFRRVVLLVCLVLGVSTVGSVQADTIFHWTMDGTLDANIVWDTDIVSGERAYSIINDDGVGEANGLFYGLSNPFYNTAGTSADFQNDETSNNRGYGLVVLDGGVDSAIDLSTLSQVTIECFVQPYLTRQSIILRKNNSPSDGGIYYIDTRPADHSYTGKGVFGIRLVGPGSEPDTLDHNSLCHDYPYDPCEWYHVALVWDGNNMKFYVDGRQSQELGGRPGDGYVPGTGVSEIPFTGPIGDSIKALGIGCQDREGITDPNVIVDVGQMFCGKIDEVRISDTALSPSEFLFTGFAQMASNPSPSNNATRVCPEGAVLSWTPGEDVNDVNGHNIYFGTSLDDANASADPCVVGHDTNSWTPPSLDLGETYYWRIDEVNDGNTWTGKIWQFTVQDGKAYNPFPSNGWKGLPADVNLSWTGSCLASSHDVYIGTDWNDVNNATSGSHPNVDYDNVSDTNYDPGALATYTWYYWRVDEVNVATVKGDVWRFKTGLGGVLLYYKFDGSEGQDLPDPNITETYRCRRRYPEVCRAQSSIQSRRDQC
jgi:hypothetical protein